MNFQYTNKSPKWSPQTSKSVQHEVPGGTWSHQNNENIEKVKSNENTKFSIVVRGWDIRIHDNYHSEIIKTRDCNPNVILNCSNQRTYEKVMQKGLQWETQNPSKITKNQFWSRLSGPLHPMITKIMKNWCPKAQNAWKIVSQDLEKSINLWIKMNEICLKRIMQLLYFQMISILQIFQIHLVCKSTVNRLLKGPAAGAKP